VALTGYGEDDARRRSAHAGFDTHLTKPIDIDALEDVLRRL
jgi:CheY-like chemotaxis protein